MIYLNLTLIVFFKFCKIIFISIRFMEGPIPLICPVCSAVFVIHEYVPDKATLYMPCLVCKRELKITPERVEIDDEDLLQDGSTSSI
jgi:hypothetical protein